MLLRSTLVAMFAFPTLISTVNGITSGLPRRSAPDIRAEAASGTTSTPPIPGKLRVVENSGVCEETTPGVYQASGYGDLDADKSIWFWFFAARNDPDQAPFIMWLNGGPGSSSMLGLFQELGPCRINNQSTGVDLNPTSWNEYANVLFVDQPCGVGFSYGTKNVGTSQEAASDVWDFLQIWFADSRFSMYSNRDFGLWTESYGGHYGPTFAAYFLQQNDAIRDGTVSGEIINLTVLGIGNGITDAYYQYAQLMQYAQSNPYHPLVSSSVISAANTSWTEAGGCMDQLIACNNDNEGTNAVCSAAQSFCNGKILAPLSGVYDPYYVLSLTPDPYPPPLEPYLHSAAVTSKIGSQSTWVKSNMEVYDQFAATGDWMRSTIRNLEAVINSGVRTLLYDGDADYILNYMGVEAMISFLNTTFSAEFAGQSFTTYTVNGDPTGLFKNAGTFSYLRIFGAGHEAPAYQGAAALQMFTQIMSGNSLSST